jgi:hypothetical protein
MRQYGVANSQAVTVEAALAPVTVTHCETVAENVKFAGLGRQGGAA